MSRDQLLEQAWGPDFEGEAKIVDQYFEGEAKIVDQYVKALRRKLEAHDGTWIIYAAHRFGYILREFRAEQTDSDLVQRESEI